MHFGIAFFPTDYSISSAELATLAEERGYESLWVAEHSHIPASRLSPWPGGADLPRDYWHCLDPFVALTSAAAATTRLRIGTGICLTIQRDPIHTAKQVASLDHVSGGRFLFGIGGGWNREEMEDHGTRYETRWRLMREQILAMKQIWTADDSEFHGEFVNFGRMWCWPKPVQAPHPPIILGGNGPNTLRRVVEFCDGWMPNRGDFFARMPELNALAAEAGRPPIPVTVYGRDTRQDIERYIEAGIERCIYYVPSASRDDAIRRLEAITELTEGLRG